MGRLIDADALKASLGMKNDCSECGNEWKACHYDRIYSKMDFCEWIDDAPTVHPEPPRMGKWIKNGNKYTCPFCGTGFTTASEEVRSAHKYCYYCGAKMEDINGTGN